MQGVTREPNESFLIALLYVFMCFLGSSIVAYKGSVNQIYIVANRDITIFTTPPVAGRASQAGELCGGWTHLPGKACDDGKSLNPFNPCLVR